MKKEGVYWIVGGTSAWKTRLSYMCGESLQWRFQFSYIYLACCIFCAVIYLSAHVPFSFFILFCYCLTHCGYSTQHYFSGFQSIIVLPSHWRESAAHVLWFVPGAASSWAACHPHNELHMGDVKLSVDFEHLQTFSQWIWRFFLMKSPFPPYLRFLTDDMHCHKYFFFCSQPPSFKGL